MPERWLFGSKENRKEVFPGLAVGRNFQGDILVIKNTGQDTYVRLHLFTEPSLPNPYDGSFNHLHIDIKKEQGEVLEAQESSYGRITLSPLRFDAQTMQIRLVNPAYIDSVSSILSIAHEGVTMFETLVQLPPRERKKWDNRFTDLLQVPLVAMKRKRGEQKKEPEDIILLEYRQKYKAIKQILQRQLIPTITQPE